MRSCISIVAALITITTLFAQQSDDISSQLQRAESGDAKAQFDLADAMGRSGDYKGGLIWLRKAADQGLPAAQRSLGFWYNRGLGMNKPRYDQAMLWYQKAANQGDKGAEFYIGQLFEIGYGVHKDLVQAAYWFHKAAADGFAFSPRKLAELSKKGIQIATVPDAQKPVASADTVLAASVPAAPVVAAKSTPQPGPVVRYEKIDKNTDLRKITGQNILDLLKARERNGKFSVKMSKNDVTPHDWAFFQSELNACALASPSNHLSSRCAELGAAFAELGNADASKAIFESAPGCQTWWSDESGSGCLNFAGMSKLKPFFPPTDFWALARIACQRENDALGCSAAGMPRVADPKAEPLSAEDIEARIAVLEIQIDGEEQIAGNDESQAANFASNSNCTFGLGNAICQAVNAAGAAKMRADANKHHNAANAERRQIQQLRGEAVQAVQNRDSSFAGNLTQTVNQNPAGTIQQTADKQAAAIRAIGDRNAAQQRVAQPTASAASQQPAATTAVAESTVNQQPAATVVVAESTTAGQTAVTLPATVYPDAPLTISFKGTNPLSTGHATVISNPAGIDCPVNCSFQFPRGLRVTLYATADESSAIHSMNCMYAPSTAPLIAGNSMACNPQTPWTGGNVIVYVDPYVSVSSRSTAPSAASVSSQSPGASLSQAQGLAGAGVTSAGVTVAGGQFNNCISPFYDPRSYNWLAFRNSCPQTLHVTWIFGAERGLGSSADISAGANASTGYSSSEVGAKNGWEVYVCPAGYLSVDAQGNGIRGGKAQPYVCKQR
jgi:Sel1 repeat